MKRSAPAQLAVVSALLAAASLLPACKNTVVFGAQREIDVAASVNEDTAEPVVVNIGLNSQMAGLVPAISEKEQSTDANDAEVPGLLGEKFILARPEGEAASLFSGFHYVSTSLYSIAPNTMPIQYDSEIRSQFASGAAAVIIAGNPVAVRHVVDVTDRVDTAPGFLADALVASRAKLQEEIDGLTEAKAKDVYDHPPTTNAAIETYIQHLKEKQGVVDTCGSLDSCRRNVTRIRVANLETIDDANKWTAAFAN